jgi:hypothetical protein
MSTINFYATWMTSLNSFNCQYRECCKLLAKNKNSGKQTKILTNKPKCRQTTQFDKTKKWFKSLEVQALLIALKKDD